MHRRTNLVRSALLVTGLGLLALGCSDDGSEGTSSTTAPSEATTTTATAGTERSTTTGAGETSEPGEATTTTADSPEVTTTTSGGAPPEGDPEVIDTFVELRTEHCTGPTPEPIGTEVDDDGRVILVDNEGNRLLVDVDEGIVTGLDGPDGELPPGYSFGCDPEVFVGTLDH